MVGVDKDEGLEVMMMVMTLPTCMASRYTSVMVARVMSCVRPGSSAFHPSSCSVALLRRS
jgi:hypothetical protein